MSRTFLFPEELSHQAADMKRCNGSKRLLCAGHHGQLGSCVEYPKMSNARHGQSLQSTSVWVTCEQAEKEDGVEAVSKLTTHLTLTVLLLDTYKLRSWMPAFCGDAFQVSK